MDGLTYLALDIGTSSLKGAVMTSSGEVRASVRHPVMGPSEPANSFSAARWTEALRRAVPQLVAGRSIDAVVLSGNGPTVVAVDERGEVVGDPLLWLDRRARRPPDSSSFYLGKIAWFHHESGYGDQVRWYLPFPEFLVFWLTGKAVAVTPGEEFSRYIWTPRERAVAGVPENVLPPFATIGTIIGEVRADRAEAIGVTAGLPVIAAGSDFLMSLVGTDTLAPGRTCDRAGTSEGVNHCAERAVSREGLRTLPHVVPGLYNVAGILSSTGLLFEWFREISGQKGRDYGDMMRDILAVDDEADIPWFFPSVHRGAAWEFQRGMFIGLGPEHDSAALGRAVVLSIGFAVREALEYLRESELTVDELRACGGQAKNELWTQMKANIAGVPIHVPAVADAELSGDVCAGMVAMGEAASLADAAGHVVTFVRTYEPETSRSRVFSRWYERYRERYERFRRALAECG